MMVRKCAGWVRAVIFYAELFPRYTNILALPEIFNESRVNEFPVLPGFALDLIELARNVLLEEI